MTDKFLKQDGSCTDWQPGDRIIMPGAMGFEAQCNRVMKKAGWEKNNADNPWVGQTSIAADGDGFDCRVFEPRKKSPGESKYSILYMQESNHGTR